jgi:hexosaminidase
MPGHSTAALAAYPGLGCTSGPFEVSCRFGIMRDIYCAGKEATFVFLQNVLDEVMDLFPSPFIHLGGDEAPKGRWKKCSHCQRRMAQEGLADEHALQVYMVNRIVDYVGARGRRAVGWNQILGPGLAESAVPQYWIGNRKAVIEAIRGGREAIVSSWRYAYLDHSYALTPLSAAYAFDPVFPELDEGDASRVLGLEALLWTEFVPNVARLDYQTFPRLTALAEMGWSSREAKDYADFCQRLSDSASRLDTLGVRYARGEDLSPPWLQRLLGWFTALQPQDRIAE